MSAADPKSTPAGQDRALWLTLDSKSIAADGKLIVGARIGDLARAHLEGRGLGMNAGIAEADDRVRALGDHRTDTGPLPAGV